MRPLSLLSAAVLSATLVPVAFAQSSVTAVGGSVTITFNANAGSYLTPLGISIGQVDPTGISGGSANLNLVTGVVDIDSGKVNIAYSGGFTLSNGTTKIRFQNLTVDTTAGKGPVITAIAVVNNTVWGQYTLFDLTPPGGLSLPLSIHGNIWTLNNVTMTLDGSAASLLNTAYGISQFTSGLNVGTASMTTHVSSTDWTY